MTRILPGQRFGRLTVLAHAGMNRWRESMYRCRCDCGEIAVALRYRLLTGQKRSCGCLVRDRARALVPIAIDARRRHVRVA